MHVKLLTGIGINSSRAFVHAYSQVKWCRVNLVSKSLMSQSVIVNLELGNKCGEPLVAGCPHALGVPVKPCCALVLAIELLTASGHPGCTNTLYLGQRHLQHVSRTTSTICLPLCQLVWLDQSKHLGTEGLVMPGVYMKIAKCIWGLTHWMLHCPDAALPFDMLQQMLHSVHPPKPLVAKADRLAGTSVH